MHSLFPMATANISDRLRELTAPTGQEEKLEVDYPRPRLHIPPWQACVLTVLVVAGVVTWLGISSHQSEKLAPVADLDVTDTVAENDSVRDNPSVGSSTSETEPSSPPRSVVVSVVGEVESSGLVTLPPEARVADALAAARPLPHVDLLGLNQAQRLHDGQQVLVLGQGSSVQGEATDSSGAGPAGPGASGSGSSKVSLNNASQQELETLSGIGEVTAAAIIAHREEIGRFDSVEQLLDVSGIGPAKFEKIKDDVSP